MQNHGIARSRPVRLALLVVAATLPVQAFAQGMMRPDVMGREAAVVSDHVLASAAGAAVGAAVVPPQALSSTVSTSMRLDQRQNDVVRMSCSLTIN